jgi:penicillin amidase
LPPGHASWEALLLDAIDEVAREVQGKQPSFEPALVNWTWGRANTVRIRHPLSGALGPLSRALRLDMPAEALPGDSRAMPRIQAPAEGASQRLAVSPGREEQGYFHMPAGQSGHPWSPHYRDGHAAWAHGQATPFLPGVTRHVIELVP